MSKEQIKKIFKLLSPIEKKRAIVSIEGKVYTWEEVIKIIEKEENSELAQKMINEIEEIIK